MKRIIERLNDLYFIQRKHYLIQYKEPTGYRQYTAGQINKHGNKEKALMDWQFEKHLNGDFTIGTYSKFFSKFLTFDVDFHDPNMAKWIAYKVANTLNELGIQNYYISFSGNKGYHIDIFFKDLIRVDYAKKFYEYVIDKSGVLEHSDIGNKVEFRVTDKLGVKIPLGIHQKSGNYCGFCDVDNGLSVMSKEDSQEYLFTIQKMSHDEIYNIIGVDADDTDKKTMIQTEDAISQHKPLESYEPNEDYSIDRAIDLLNNGLQVQGSRYNSIFLIGLYFKYMGLDEADCKSELIIWMDKQNKNTYNDPLKQCYKEIDRTVENMYKKNYSMTANKKDLTVTYDDIKWIMDSCPEKNQKLITYAMLIHSKRFATMQGVFYMTFKQMAEATGLDDNTVQRQIDKLIGLGVIEAVERNMKQKGTFVKKVNKYKLLVGNSNNQNIDEGEIYTTYQQNDIYTCMRFYFTDKELKKMLPRKQYEDIEVSII